MVFGDKGVTIISELLVHPYRDPMPIIGVIMNYTV
jgi:hypothetical protein